MNNKTQETEEAKTVLLKEASAIREVANRLSVKDFTRAIDILLKKGGKDYCHWHRKIWICSEKNSGDVMQHGFSSIISAPSRSCSRRFGYSPKGDPVIFLSNSGSTPELIYLEPVFRSRGAQIVGILGKQKVP